MLFKDEGCRAIRENIYESYVMKKYFGYTKLEMRNVIRKKLGEIRSSVNLDEEFSKLTVIEEKVEKADDPSFFLNVSKIDLGTMYCSLVKTR